VRPLLADRFCPLFWSLLCTPASVYVCSGCGVAVLGVMVWVFRLCGGLARFWRWGSVLVVVERVPVGSPVVVGSLGLLFRFSVVFLCFYWLL
jgi:hypothetical protein